MKSSRLTALGVVLAPALAVALGLGSLAHGDERASTVATLAALEKDTAHAALVKDDVKRARDALERATRMRDANDEKRARLTEGLASDWAELGRDRVRAADAVSKVNDTILDADDAGARADRERALLEESVARQGRLRAEIDALARRSKESPERTSVAGASADAGAKAAVSKAPPIQGADAGGVAP